MLLDAEKYASVIEYGKDASHYSGHGIKMLVPDDKGDIFQQDIP